MLDVERSINVDPVAQQLLDVEAAFWVPAASNIGVGELVDQGELRAAGEESIKVHLLQRAILVSKTMTRDHF